MRAFGGVAVRKGGGPILWLLPVVAVPGEELLEEDSKRLSSSRPRNMPP